MSNQAADFSSKDASEIFQNKVTLNAIAKGSTPGLTGKRFDKTELKELQQNWKEQEDKAKKSVSGKQPSLVDPILCAYTGAAYRDADYCCMGRVAMRIAGLNEKLRIVETRGSALKRLEAYKKK